MPRGRRRQTTPRRRRSARPRLGGYLRGARLLVLCGAQGAGKSFFCERLLEEGSSLGAAAPEWIVVCQDTAPGKKRDAVERAARDALRRGCSVVVDRMHLTADQRAHFVAIATECAVPCHALLLAPPLSEMESRVRHRTDHPGNVEGERGVGVLRGSAKKTTAPRYAEGFELVSVAHRPADALAYARLYAAAGAAPAEEGAPCACGAGRGVADVEDREEPGPQVLQVLVPAEADAAPSRRARGRRRRRRRGGGGGGGVPGGGGRGSGGGGAAARVRAVGGGALPSIALGTMGEQR